MEGFVLSGIRMVGNRRNELWSCEVCRRVFELEDASRDRPAHEAVVSEMRNHVLDHVPASERVGLAR
jgi:hypothetical protein